MAMKSRCCPASPSDDRKTIEELFVRAPMSPKAYIELTDAIAAAIAGPKVDVQLGPAGVQWCSKPLLEAVAENSAQTGRRIHMHLLETIYQRAWADQHFPDGIVRYLRDIGFLSERLTLAHCIHARPDEIEMIAASGARIVTNFTSNMHLRSGLAPIAAAHKCGCAIAVGVDGLALDEDDDVLREMRLVQMLHGGLGFQRTWTTSEFLGLAIANGRKATGAPGTGALVSGAPADFVTIDLDRLDRDQIMPVDAIELLFARGNASLLRDVVVDGRTIVSEGRCTGVDLPAIEKELRGIYRANAGAFRPSARVAAAFGVASELVRSASGLPLGRRASRLSNPIRVSRRIRTTLVLRAHHVFRKAEQNSTCIGMPARFHVRQQETEPAPHAPVMRP